jgi:mono/diheme cytochrome c family protein
MRLKCLAAGVAVLVAVGIWQGRAGPEAEEKQKGSADRAELVKHGEYLVSSVGMCGDCHTPRDAKGKPDRSKMLRGSTLNFAPKKKTKGWVDEAPDITGGGVAGEWSEEDLIKFLSTGTNAHGEKAHPPMPAFRLNKKDARAVALYLKSLGKKGKGAGEK